MEFICVASGSKGNCYLVRNEKTSVLIDCGISVRELKKRLLVHNIEISSINALLVTHEHDDHIHGASALCTQYDIPLYVTQASYQADQRLQEISLHKVFFFSPDRDFSIGSLDIETFNVPHDAAQTVALRMWHGKVSLCVVTDIGDYDDHILSRCVGADGLILEVNHDHEMLWSCRYPWFVKKRISGPNGHLSNNRAKEFIREVLQRSKTSSRNLKYLAAAHISDNSNDHERAMSVLVEGTEDACIQPSLFLAKQREVSEIYSI